MVGRGRMAVIINGRFDRYHWPARRCAGGSHILFQRLCAVNSFGSACMAGWSCYNRLDSFIMLPMQSMSQAATTFVGQNIGAGRKDRVNQGTVRSGGCLSFTDS